MVIDCESYDYGANTRLIMFSGESPSMRDAVQIAYEKSGGMEPVSIEIDGCSWYRGLLNLGSLSIRYSD